MTPADLSEIKEQLKSIDNSGQGWKWDWVDGCVHDEDTDEVICVVEADDDGAIGDFIANSITRIPDLLAHISELTGNSGRLEAENRQLIEKLEQLETETVKQEGPLICKYCGNHFHSIGPNDKYEHNWSKCLQEHSKLKFPDVMGGGRHG